MRLGIINQELVKLFSKGTSLFIESKDMSKYVEHVSNFEGLSKLIAITDNVPRSLTMSFEDLKKERDDFLQELSISTWYCRDILQGVCEDWFRLITKRKRSMLISDSLKRMVDNDPC